MQNCVDKIDEDLRNSKVDLNERLSSQMSGLDTLTRDLNIMLLNRRDSSPTRETQTMAEASPENAEEDIDDLL